MDVSEIMSRRLVTVSAGSDLMPAMDLMIESGLSGLMVLNDAGALCGILSEGDLLRRIELGTAPPTKAWHPWISPRPTASRMDERCRTS